MQKDQVEIYVTVKRETEAAILATDGVNEFWLPKSQIEMEHIKDFDYEITMPEWLAKVKEII